MKQKQNQKETRELNHPSHKDVQRFEMLYPMLISARDEMRTLANKKPDSVLNPLKVKFLNQILDDIFQLLGNDASTTFLSLLDDETLPQNSDAVLVLGRFEAAMSQFKGKHYHRGSATWLTQD